ncbi:MAG: retropepsin-like aspartic protease [Acetobacteraceae bacterium]
MQRVAEVPLTLQDGLLTVPATIEDKPVTMVVDTGAERTLITPNTVSELRLDRDKDHRTTVMGTGGSTVSANAKLQSFGFGGFELLDQSYAVSPLGPSARESGLLGADWLSQFDVEIDVPQRRMALYQVHGCDGRYIPWRGPYANFTHVRQYGVGLPLLPIQIGGQPVTAILDSGSNITQMTDAAASRLGVSEAELAAGPAGHSFGVDQTQLTTHLHRFADMDVGADHFASVLLSVGPVQVPEADMLLGADYLWTRRVWLSYETHQVFIQHSTPAG